MSRKYDTAYIDWDGVIWDFKQAWIDWFDWTSPTHVRDLEQNEGDWFFYRGILSDEEFKNALNWLPQNFWQQEKYITPHAHDLVRWARANADRVFVLTVAPEWSTAKGKQNLARKYFDLAIYTVACAEEKVKYAKDGCLIIDDKASTVLGFNRTQYRACGYVWPTNYNQGLAKSWYFNKDWLHEHKSHCALTDSDRADLLKKVRDEVKAQEFIYSGAKVWLPETGVSCSEVCENFAKASKRIWDYEKLYDLGQKPATLEEMRDVLAKDMKPTEDKPNKRVGSMFDVDFYDYSGRLTEKPKLGDKSNIDNKTKESENMKPTNPKDIAGSSKVPMNSMLSGAVMGEVALALFEGALKYGRHNYRQDGVRASVYYDAVGRHLSAWWEGEDVDEESGLSHITKAIAGLHILRDCSIRGMCNDDRPPKTADFMKELNNKTKALIEKYPNPVPPVLEKEQGQCVPEDKPYSEGMNHLLSTRTVLGLLQESFRQERRGR